VRKIEDHDGVSTGIFAHEFLDKYPCEWIKQALITLEKATEVYMVKETAEFHC
jgi:hypothetical protein